MKELKLIIAGSRDFNDYNLLKESCDLFLSELKWENVEIVCGTARGADTLGEKYGKKSGFPIIYFPAEWDLYGKSAGHRRNRQMARYGSHAIIFWDGKSKGSKGMIELCQHNNLKYKVIKY
jgi:hypothetical protein